MMMKKHFTHFMIALCWLLPLTAWAQYSTAGLSKNNDKFLGNITTGGSNADWGRFTFSTLWNQITPENETKWDAIEPSRGGFSFWGADRSADYAKNHNFIFKYHTLIWGGQYPSWVNNLSITEQYKAIVEYFDGVKEHYPNLEIIDVVNEAVAGHAPAPYKAALGGDGRTGFDWIIKAFELAHERWPNAILVYNDYNTFQHQKSQYIDLVRTLRDAGAPVDAYGCQSHDLTDMSESDFKSAMVEIQNALKMPMYSTEYDIGTTNDALQLQRYKEQIPYMWQADYCAGITLWGYIYGHTWTTDGNSGIVKEDGKERPAMSWLREYMASEEAKTAKSPFPGMKKHVAVFVQPAALNIAQGDQMKVKVRAYLTDEEKEKNPDLAIEKVELYAGNECIATMTEEPYIADYTAPTGSTAAGQKTLKAIVYTNDGQTYERLSRVKVLSAITKREPYNGTAVEIPGTIKSGEYDKGATGVAFSSAVGREGTNATRDGGWMEYTIDVKEDGLYSYDIEVASTKTGGLFHLSEYGLGSMIFYSDFIEVPTTGSTTEYQTLHGVLREEMTKGEHHLCLNIDKGGFHIKSITLKPYKQEKSISASVTSVSPTAIYVGESATINVKASTTSEENPIASVNVYANGLLIGTMEEAPYTMTYTPASKGTYAITAIAIDKDGSESKMSSSQSLKVKAQRSPYNDTPATIPGTIEAENFDQGGEKIGFHDLNDNGQGNAQDYRDDSEGADIESRSNNGYAIGYTEKNEWLEYTVNVEKAGQYKYEAVVSSGVSTSSFRIRLHKGNDFITLADIAVPQTGNNNWGTYTTVKGYLSKELEEGEQIIRFSITGNQCNIDKVKFIYVEPDAITDLTAEPVNVIDGQKVIENGQLIIYRSGKKYNAVGVEVK